MAELIEKNIASKIKRLFVVFRRKIAHFINRQIFRYYRRKPINQNLFVLESEGDCSDNAFALFRCMEKEGLIEKNKIVWLVDDPENFHNIDNVRYVQKWGDQISITRSKSLATCRYYLYDHVNVLEDFPSRDGQKYIFLTHGCGFKAPTREKDFVTNADEVYLTGNLYHELAVVGYCCRLECIHSLGYPRLDYFFEPLGQKQKDFMKKYSFEKYKKIALWMPTFRRSYSSQIDEEYFNSATGLPIIDTVDSLVDLDNYLQEVNTLCIFKIHHLQAALPVFTYKFSNILVIKDAMLAEAELQLYQFVMLTDFLITDYSSIGNDYLLLNRPIIYTMDDYDEYAQARGFLIPNVKDYLIGHQVKTVDELKEAIEVIVVEDKDEYREQRNSTISMMHEHIDGNASKRILKHLEIVS